MFKSRVFRRFVNSLNTGSLIQHVFTSQLAEFALPLPPLAEQHRTAEEIERRFSVVSVLESTIDANLTRAERLRQAILKRAFEGRLVPQDPDDEPASVLLERIKAERENANA
jgi:type I restriction enzyme S subunit